MPSHQVQITLRRERLPTLPFQRDERAALPRKPGAGLDYVKITAGVPEPIRSRLGQNIFVSAFPYPQWLRGTGRLVHQEFSLVDVQNSRWHLTVCPDLGGRILGLFDKRLGCQLLWQPPAFRLAPIGLPGAWLLGGMEFNAFRFGHTVHGMMPVRTERVRLAGGLTGLRWGAVDELLESEWSIIVVPLADRVAVQVTLQNHSDRPQPGYWWTNIAVPAQQGSRFFYHPGPVLHHGFDSGMLYQQWPNLHGSDWQWWQNHSGIISAYWPEYGSDVFGYAPPGEGWALAHHADRRVCRGRKLWSVGSGHDTDVWMERVGEASAESYCEIQSGRLPTQLEADLLKPKTRLSWVESFTTIPCPSHPAAATAFRQFARAADAAFRPDGNSPPCGRPDFWRVTHAETLIEEDARAALSRKAVLAPASLTSREVEQATRRGWVGGAPWVRYLSNAPEGEWRDLALGAAQLDLNAAAKAVPRLQRLAGKRGSPCSGFASLLLGCHEYHRSRLPAAIKHLQRAVARLPENLQAASWLHQALLETNRISEARRFWRHQPPALAASDAARYARAQIAFLEARWSDARAELSAPMPGIAEGAAGPWLLRKEIELADAIECQRAGRSDEAQHRLIVACDLMPQFGVGRYETTGNVDIMFYRWLLAVRAGATWQAGALASHLLRYRPPAGSVEAAYLLRLARAIGDSSVGSRTAALDAWDAEAEPIWPWLLPLRSAARRQSPAGWRTLRNHLLYRYRARFELDLARKTRH